MLPVPPAVPLPPMVVDPYHRRLPRLVLCLVFSKDPPLDQRNAVTRRVQHRRSPVSGTGRKGSVETTFTEASTASERGEVPGWAHPVVVDNSGLQVERESHPCGT